jgi:SAM-dependent methyltransferase
VTRAREQAARSGLDAQFVQADIFKLPARYSGTFDLVVEHAFFCAINPERRGDYVRLVHHLLRPGGELVGLFLAHGRAGGPPFSTSQEEIEELFAPLFDIRRLEPAADSVPSRAGQELFALMTRRQSS